MELRRPFKASPTVGPTGKLRRIALAGYLAWLGLLCQFSTGFSAELVSEEYQLKAAFLFNFAKFVEWPSQRFDTAASPIIIGVFGESPFGDALERLTRDRTINGRPILVRSVQSTAAARETHLLFFCADEDNHFPERSHALNVSNTLTVGESDAFGRRGGIINFVMEGQKLRFEINIGEAAGAGLKMSAQLQKLAKNIRR